MCVIKNLVQEIIKTSKNFSYVFGSSFTKADYSTGCIKNGIRNKRFYRAINKQFFLYVKSGSQSIY